MEKNQKKKENKTNDDDTISFTKAFRYTDQIIYTGILLLVGLLLFTLFQWHGSIKLETERRECFQDFSRQLMQYSGIPIVDGTPATYGQIKYQLKDNQTKTILAEKDWIADYNKCIRTGEKQ